MSWSFLDFTGLSRFFGRLPEKLVTTDTTQTISGTKSFSSTILGSVSGSAASASKDGAGNVIADTYETKEDAATHLSKSDAAGTYLSKTDAASTCVQTGAVDQTVAGTKTFSKPIVGSVTGSSGSCTGNAATATTATTAEACTGNAATATKLATARSLWGNNFDGSAAITGAIIGTSGIEFKPVATTANNGGVLDFHYNQSTADYTSRIIESASGTLSINYVTITTGRVVTAATFIGELKGNVTGNCSGSSGSCTGNAASANIATKADSATKAANADHATSADSATNATYANWLRTSSHSDCLFHTEWDGSGFWTYVTAGDGGYRAVRVARSDSSGNADTATKLATARTIALSGAATGTATGFDGSDNITIPVTALSSSAIRAQWYAAYPDGAEAHNAMWGGRDITAAFDSGEFSEHIADGTFKDIFPGDYITKQVTISGTTYTVNWVVADCDYWINKSDQNNGMETHHVVIVPQAPIFNTNMNATNTTEGGYAGSRMYRETIPACATGIVNAFGSDHILTFRDLIVKAVDTSSISSGVPFWTGASSEWGWYDAQCNLMCERMVYGMPAFSSSAWDAGVATRQMSAFRLSERLINYNRPWWWLRDVVSSEHFASVDGIGNAAATNASDVRSVRPFALLV